ncbi:uncharacterized protein BXIN_1615 [Babesia sp. Xinjiang]|uniref:uncharacterized protein n=1 Tax=Babesia sp. Xinjiang TaxID=462227 RepID=UPI000A244784|nr:uncharacterized protein BXIN_1804 [Babesia sp. Xinjiang]XP_028871463.1 uncharacterized protein BXIN_1615 [Babesia sp. Xinjiang]ORM40937.1 hypothetical protein BXIN_1804 [Babesia sp. Xinjiang]ORM41007.1 hypothetical protein BXIN_1615 [Babesia sp. Xinjiang]
MAILMDLLGEDENWDDTRRIDRWAPLATDLPNVHRVTPAQKLMIVLLIRLQSVNEVWAAYGNNFAVHYRNLLYENRGNRRHAYIAIFIRLAAFYKLHVTATITDAHLMSLPDELLTRIIHEPFEQLERLRSQKETGYIPMQEYDITLGFNIEKVAQLGNYIRKVCLILCYFRQAVDNEIPMRIIRSMDDTNGNKHITW